MASKKHLKTLIHSFYELSRSQQENFLHHIHHLSKENADIFEVWLNNGSEKVFDRLKKEIEKETLSRVGRYRKLRVAKLNEIIKTAKSYPLSDFLMIELYNQLWKNTLTFIINTGYVPNRYREVCVRYLSEYLESLKNIRESQERIERENECKQLIQGTIESNAYFPHLTDFYMDQFHQK